MKFTVKWEVEFYDHDKKLYCDIDEDDDNINNLVITLLWDQVSQMH